MTSSDDFIPYGRQFVDDEDVAAVVAALRSDYLTTGPAVAAFEQALSDVAGGVPVVAVSSGTAGLHAAYAAAGVGPGNDVLTVPLTFAATATAALHLGAGVDFTDVDEDTLTMDPEAARAAMRPGTRVVAPVDFGGHPAPMDDINAVAEAHGATVVQDAAHSLGSTYRGTPVGACADLTVFSFHPVKTVTTAEGGAVAVRDGTLLQRIRDFRTHGLVRDAERMRQPDEGGWHQEIHDLGLNYRLPDVLAALGASQLRKLDAFVRRRDQIVRRYDAALADCPGLRLPVTRGDCEPVRHLYPVRILDGRRRAVYDELHRLGVGVQVHYLPVYLHPVFQDLGYRRGMCPVAEAAYGQLLSLPLFPALTDAQQDRVITAVRAVLGG